jgi:hypothetical protein
MICETFEWQAISVANICQPFRSGVQSLIIKFCGYWVIGTDPGLWLQIFHSFPSVQSLTIPVELEPYIGSALQLLTGESVAEVFPALQSLSIDGIGLDETARRGIQSLIATRQRCGRPVAFSHNAYIP